MSPKELEKRGMKTRFKTGPAQVKIARLGGLANKDNPKTQIAATLREWKKKLDLNPALVDADKKAVLEIWESGPSGRFWLLQHYARMLTKAKTEALQVMLLRDINTLIEHQHGKAVVKTENVNVNIELQAKEYDWHNEAVNDVLQEKAPELLKDIYVRYLELKNGGSI